MVGRDAYIPTAQSWEEAIHSTIPSQSNQYWSAIRPLLVTTRSSTGHYCLPVLVRSATSTGSFYPSHSSAHRDEGEQTHIEVWYARELQKLLGYAQWENFAVAIQRVITSYKSNEVNDLGHFREVTKMVELGSGS